MNFSNYN